MSCPIQCFSLHRKSIGPWAHHNPAKRRRDARFGLYRPDTPSHGRPGAGLRLPRLEFDGRERLRVHREFGRSCRQCVFCSTNASMSATSWRVASARFIRRHADVHALEQIVHRQVVPVRQELPAGQRRRLIDAGDRVQGNWRTCLHTAFRRVRPARRCARRSRYRKLPQQLRSQSRSRTSSVVLVVTRARQESRRDEPGMQRVRRMPRTARRRFVRWRSDNRSAG
jgi:hypothetical protein